ncbi:tetratricopeptide repeat protein [Alkalilimnicola ehrlichii]|nr:tetratricopeptide repeat protein [Alkalilimnicola ehrlichii]
MIQTKENRRNLLCRLGALLALGFILGGCASMTVAPVAESQEALLADADAAYTAGQYARAAAAYSQIVAARPEDSQARFRLANAYVETGRLEEAVDVFRQLLELDPTHAKARHNLGLLYIELGVANLLKARPDLPRVDTQAQSTMQYLACVMETFMGRPNPPTCHPDAEP